MYSHWLVIVNVLSRCLPVINEEFRLRVVAYIYCFELGRTTWAWVIGDVVSDVGSTRSTLFVSKWVVFVQLISAWPHHHFSFINVIKSWDISRFSTGIYMFYVGISKWPRANVCLTFCHILENCTACRWPFPSLLTVHFKLNVLRPGLLTAR